MQKSGLHGKQKYLIELYRRNQWTRPYQNAGRPVTREMHRKRRVIHFCRSHITRRRIRSPWMKTNTFYRHSRKWMNGRVEQVQNLRKVKVSSLPAIHSRVRSVRCQCLYTNKVCTHQAFSRYSPHTSTTWTPKCTSVSSRRGRKILQFLHKSQHYTPVESYFLLASGVLHPYSANHYTN